MARGITVTNNLGSAMGDILERLDRFLDDVRVAEQSSARTATTVTQTSFKRKRPIAPPRRGRHGRGQMAKSASWRATRGGNVQFNYSGMNRDEPQWIIQEIGTGRRATLRQGSKPNPVGRPTAGATYVRTVKSQIGRRISPSLVWASNGRYVRPGAGRNQQLYLRRQVFGYPAHGHPASIRIKREIRGQHFVQKGGEAGFREFRTTVLAAARTQLKRR